MKSFFVLAAASLAVVNAVDCDLTKVAPLLTDADVKQCGADTGLSPPTPASAEVLPKLCGNKACLAALAKLKALGVGDCVVLGVSLETDFINPIESYCAKATPASTPAPATTTTAPAGSSPSPTTAAPGSTPAPTTKAPTTTTNSTTPAPAKTTATPTTSGGSKSGSDATIEEGGGKTILSPSGSGSSTGTTIKTPVKTTPAPTPTKSGASSLAFAASAVVLAVAASFM
ncbi:hypothetical protein Gpo141_00004097 [Globisporangium polare]